MLTERVFGLLIQSLIWMCILFLYYEGHPYIVFPSILIIFTLIISLFLYFYEFLFNSKVFSLISKKKITIGTVKELLIKLAKSKPYVEIHAKAFHFNKHEKEETTFEKLYLYEFNNIDDVSATKDLEQVLQENLTSLQTQLILIDLNLEIIFNDNDCIDDLNACVNKIKNETSFLDKYYEVKTKYIFKSLKLEENLFIFNQGKNNLLFNKYLFVFSYLILLGEFYKMIIQKNIIKIDFEMIKKVMNTGNTSKLGKIINYDPFFEDESEHIDLLNSLENNNDRVDKCNTKNSSNGNSTNKETSSSYNKNKSKKNYDVFGNNDNYKNETPLELIPDDLNTHLLNYDNYDDNKNKNTANSRKDRNNGASKNNANNDALLRDIPEVTSVADIQESQNNNIYFDNKNNANKKDLRASQQNSHNNIGHKKKLNHNVVIDNYDPIFDAKPINSLESNPQHTNTDKTHSSKSKASGKDLSSISLNNTNSNNTNNTIVSPLYNKNNDANNNDYYISLKDDFIPQNETSSQQDPAIKKSQVYQKKSVVDYYNYNNNVENENSNSNKSAERRNRHNHNNSENKSLSNTFTKENFRFNLPLELTTSLDYSRMQSSIGDQATDEEEDEDADYSNIVNDNIFDMFEGSNQVIVKKKVKKSKAHKSSSMKKETTSNINKIIK